MGEAKGNWKREGVLRVDSILQVAQERLATVGDDALLIDAARLLNGPQFNLVVVCDASGKAVGVITKTDVVSRISYCTGCCCSMPATQVMTTDIVSCRPSDLLSDVWSALKARGLKNAPVLDQQSAPIGVANARDVLQSLLQDVEYEEKMLHDYVMGVGYR